MSRPWSQTSRPAAARRAAAAPASWLAAVALLALVFGGCVNLLGDFSFATDPPRDGGVDGTAPSADSGPDADVGDASVPTSDAAIDGAGRDTGPSIDAHADAPDAATECPDGTKLCASTCVAITDPKYGCTATGCAACSLPNATATCAAGACAVAQCATGYLHCSANASDGCEVHDAVDVAHCGSCTNVCKGTSSATPSCAGGVCSSVACPANKADCNGDPNDGCEVSTSSDAKNCGVCANVCGTANGTPTCSGGACKFACTAPYAHCASSTDGVGCNIDTSSDPGNCGVCGNQCTPGQTCKAGKCVCDPSTCGGCCSGTSCLAGTFPTCGKSGAQCTSCDTTRNDECNGNGCGCSTNGGSTCGAGLHCTSSGCACDPTSCGSGCCSGGTCASTPAWPSCGSGGASCHTCDARSDRCGAGGACACGNGGECPLGDSCGGGACSCDATACGALSQSCCGTSCVDTKSDANNCGACGHSCQGSTCMNGACLPILLTNSPENGSMIATDGTTVFWTAVQGVSGTTNEAAVYSCPVTGCSAATSLFSSSGSYIGIGNVVVGASSWAGNVFFAYDASSSTVFSMAKTGGTTTPIVSGLSSGPAAIAYDPISNWVYTPAGQVIYRTKPDGTQKTTAVTGASSVFYAYVDGKNVYYVDNNGQGVSYAPLNSTNATGTVLLASGNIKTFRDMYADGSNVWITDMGSGGTAGDGVVYKCPVGQTCTSANKFSTGQLDPWAIVADGSYVYWSDFTGYSIVKCPLSGCPSSGPIPVATTNTQSVYSLAQDATFLYFTNGSQVQKVAK